MKHLLTSAGILAAFISAAAAPAPADTIKTLQNVNNVTISESGGKTTITITGCDDGTSYEYRLDTETITTADNGMSTIERIFDFSLPFTGGTKKQSEWDRYRMLWFRDIYTGILLENDFPGMGGGWEIGIGEVAAISYRPWRHGPRFRIGAGFGFRSMGTRHSHTFDLVDGNLTLSPVADGNYNNSSRITSGYIRVPFSISQHIYRAFFIGCSAILNFNIHTTASSRYETDNISYRETYTGLHQRLLTPEFRATIGFAEAVAVYYSSSFTTMRRGFGPQFRHSAIGLSLFF